MPTASKKIIKKGDIVSKKRKGRGSAKKEQHVSFRWKERAKTQKREFVEKHSVRKTMEHSK